MEVDMILLYSQIDHHPLLQCRCPHIKGVKVTAVVPSGAFTGIYETLELSDGGSDYLGKDASKAVDNFMVYELMEPKMSGLGANCIIDACKPGVIVNGIRLYKAKIEEQQVNID
ncbi:hypothetical protein HID58_061880 [Brassica napus]|uniref:Uncharacterized protein n=1 Tax=Brassica napus TaxID=3708 RepID=A0ABQ7ZZU1_BRANA|nr:hypothetical protein HID58_061880 [Brassica napus]